MGRREFSPPARNRNEGPISVVAVLNGEDVPARILEPGNFHGASHVDVTLAGQAGKIVVLELDPLAFELLHRPVDVIDFPECGCALVRAGKLGAIDDERGVAAPISDGLAGHLARFFQPQRLLVKFLRASEVLDWKHRLNFCITQHFGLLSQNPWVHPCRIVAKIARPSRHPVSLFAWSRSRVTAARTRCRPRWKATCPGGIARRRGPRASNARARSPARCGVAQDRPSPGEPYRCRAARRSGR